MGKFELFFDTLFYKDAYMFLLLVWWIVLVVGLVGQKSDGKEAAAFSTGFVGVILFLFFVFSFMEVDSEDYQEVSKKNCVSENYDVKKKVKLFIKDSNDTLDFLEYRNIVFEEDACKRENQTLEQNEIEKAQKNKAIEKILRD